MDKFVRMTGINIEHLDNLDELELVYHTVYKEVERIYNQKNMTDQMWEYYKTVGITGLPEQIELEEALNKLTKELKRIVRKNEINKNSNTTSSQVV